VALALNEIVRERNEVLLLSEITMHGAAGVMALAEEQF
jgi:hypothetical protein